MTRDRWVGAGWVLVMIACVFAAGVIVWAMTRTVL